MVTEKIYKMSDYCARIKNYIEEYEEVGLAQYNNPREELYTLIKSASDDMLMFISVSDLIGRVTRRFNDFGGAFTFPDWIGGKDESFTKEHFVETLKNVWPQLFT